ncbi:pyridoxamine 5'-phosphate oxidase family protein [Galbitalea soli]|uniref:Pyridoxamine 5'-phosphate oxidase family protein n=1 Tax=Galbitalea soli TaxID=1268042 RepID=A0A7C9PLJ1_9MICO|nr:pyridoxamine 5'-phosphate oxidase family protein [Galbitalea soli]NEM90071.1 pyridoxamine 5'-phosphate oxidase family protein [Galbitalea soli]NYJ30778.1 nitroimidazol reductase NimA-like FMN-containing flavoprotein (pyridoxamine 5'-phosphate oxidase superfamily) [Galbitalea soli]
MSDSANPVELLGSDEAWRLLAAHSFGRLALAAAGEVDVFPINYFCDGHSILLRTAPGTKLLELAITGRAVLEIDEYTDTVAWSVVAKGPASELESQTEIDEADRAPLTPWIPTLKYRYVRIHPTEVTGRRFSRGPEPVRDLV